MELVESSKLKKINDSYSKALKFLQKDDYKSAVKELRENLDVHLYDISIDILFNRNEYSTSKEFDDIKQLIKMVDNKLTYFYKEKENNVDLEDNFQGDIF